MKTPVTHLTRQALDLCILNPIALAKSSRRLEFVKYVESQGAIFVAIHLRAFCCFRGLEDGCWQVDG